MRFYELGSLTILIIIAVISSVGFFSHLYLGHDNELEEAVEEFIEEKTGIDIDLTPSTKESQPQCVEVVKF